MPTNLTWAMSVIATGASAQSLEERIRTLEESMLMGAPGTGFDITVSGYIHGGFFLQDLDSNIIGAHANHIRDDDGDLLTGQALTNALTATGEDAPMAREDYGSTDVKMGGAEAQFTATTVLDNGIEIMGRVELSGFTTSDQIDETYIRVQGGFGRVVLGADDDAWNLTHYSSPNPGLNGVDSPNYRHAVAAGARTGTNASLTNDANKITYFTPRFSGFQFGISYTPNTVDVNGDSNVDAYDRNSGEHIENVVGVGGNFTRDFGGVAVGASAGWQSGSTNERLEGTTNIKTDPAQWHIGGNVSRGGFTVGGAYANYEGTGGNTKIQVGAGENGDNEGSIMMMDVSDKLQATAWTVGAIYNTGPWTVGIGYLQSEQDEARPSLARNDEGAITAHNVTTFTGETSVVGLGGKYALAPGVDVAADVSFYEDDNGQPNGTQEGVAAGIIMGINF